MTNGEKRRLLRLTAGDACVELDTSCVRRVVEARGMIQLPLTRPRVVGVLVADNEVVPVYHLEEIEGSERLGGANGTTVTGTIVILEEDGALAGFLVERAEFVKSGPRSEDDTTSMETKRRLLAAAGVMLDAPGPASSAVATAEGESHRDEEEGIPGR